NGFGQIGVLTHPGHVQSFDNDRWVLADDLRGEFLKRVPAGVADLGVQPRHFELGFLAIIAALALARHATLKSLPSLFAPDERARVFESLPSLVVASVLMPTSLPTSALVFRSGLTSGSTRILTKSRPLVSRLIVKFRSFASSGSCRLHTMSRGSDCLARVISPSL